MNEKSFVNENDFYNSPRMRMMNEGEGEGDGDGERKEISCYYFIESLLLSARFRCI